MSDDTDLKWAHVSKLRTRVDAQQEKIRELVDNDHKQIKLINKLTDNFNENGKLLMSLNKCLEGIISNQEDFQARLKKLEDRLSFVNEFQMPMQHQKNIELEERMKKLEVQMSDQEHNEFHFTGC